MRSSPARTWADYIGVKCVVQALRWGFLVLLSAPWLITQLQPRTYWASRSFGTVRTKRFVGGGFGSESGGLPTRRASWCFQPRRGCAERDRGGRHRPRASNPPGPDSSHGRTRFVMSVAGVWSRVKPIGRSRPAGLALAVLAAALLMAPLVHCSIPGIGVQSDGAAPHSHTTATQITALVASAVDRPAHAIADVGDRHDAPHAVHCVITYALPAAVGSFVPLLLLLSVLVAATVVAAAVYRMGSGGVRGPPVARVPIVCGRVLLTRLCIARR